MNKEDMDENAYGDIEGLTWEINEEIIELIFGLKSY